MINVVGVTFKNNSKVYYFLPNGLNLKKGMNVIVRTDRGLVFATIKIENRNMESSRFTSPLNDVVKICTEEDIKENEKNVKEAKKAIEKCKELIKKYNLNMAILNATYNFDRSQLLFTFLADNRVDFRKLAKDLSSICKTRIELRQVGVRDKAREIGGQGICGKNLCCSNFLNDIDSVSISMAKNQNIALNPNKINGVCGRLLCCLKYEDGCYREYSKKMPKLGKKVITNQGEGKVISIDILKQSYRVLIKDAGVVEVNINESN